MRDFELVVPAGFGGMVEEHGVVAQGFTRAIRKRLSIVTANRMRQFTTSGLEVALHASLKLALTGKPGRVKNCAPNRIRRRAPGPGGLHMGVAWSVTSLAVNRFPALGVYPLIRVTG